MRLDWAKFGRQKPAGLRLDRVCAKERASRHGQYRPLI